MEEKKQQPSLVLNDVYSLTSDGSRNLILQELYETRLGKGKNAKLSGEFSKRDVSYHGAGLDSLIHRFKDESFLESFGSVEDGKHILEALDDMKAFLTEYKKDILNHVKEHLTLELKNVKNSKEDSDKDE